MKRESSHSSHIWFVSVMEESHVHSSLILDCMFPWPLWLVIVSWSSFDDSQILSGFLDWELSEFFFINNLEFYASKTKDTRESAIYHIKSKLFPINKTSLLILISISWRKQHVSVFSMVGLVIQLPLSCCTHNTRTLNSISLRTVDL